MFRIAVVISNDRQLKDMGPRMENWGVYRVLSIITAIDAIAVIRTIFSFHTSTNMLVFFISSYFLLSILIVDSAIFPFVKIPTIQGPCSVILKDMMFSGYTVRDCSYLDPFVYWRIEYRMTWEGARSACKQIPGGDLASIHSFDEKQIVSAMGENNYVNLLNSQKGLPWEAGDQGVWIGLIDRNKTGKGWQWVDRSPYDYKDWLSGQPDQGTGNKQHCAQLISVGGRIVAKGWNDIGCKWNMKAICKVPRVAIFP